MHPRYIETRIEEPPEEVQFRLEAQLLQAETLLQEIQDTILEARVYTARANKALSKRHLKAVK